jgi:hypothetical protein
MKGPILNSEEGPFCSFRFLLSDNRYFQPLNGQTQGLPLITLVNSFRVAVAVPIFPTTIPAA